MRDRGDTDEKFAHLGNPLVAILGTAVLRTRGIRALEVGDEVGDGGARDRASKSVTVPFGNRVHHVTRRN